MAALPIWPQGDAQKWKVWKAKDKEVSGPRIASFLSGTQSLSKNPTPVDFGLYTYWPAITPHDPFLLRRWLEREGGTWIESASVNCQCVCQKPHRDKDLFLTHTNQVPFWGEFPKKDLVKWNFQKTSQGQDYRTWVPNSCPTPFSKENWGTIFLCYFYSSISLY